MDFISAQEPFLESSPEDSPVDDSVTPRPADGANLPQDLEVTSPPLTPGRVIHGEMSIVLGDVVKSPGELFYSIVCD